jgi:hypothetical protein
MIVSLEGGTCSCAKCKAFLVTGAERKHVRGRAHELLSSFFFLQGKVPKEIHTILIETLGEHTPSYATFKNWVAQFNL